MLLMNIFTRITNMGRLSAVLIILILMILTAGCAQPEVAPEIIILYDHPPDILMTEKEWGFSCLVRLPHTTILFDTGADSSILLRNMSQLQIDPKEVEVVVLSHVHSDHVGGLAGFLRQNSDVTVYMTSLSLFTAWFEDDLESFGAKVEEIHEARELLPGVYTTGELEGQWEQSLIITTDQGLVIVTGCSHPGVLNIIRRAKEIVPDSEVYLVLGGWHLGWSGYLEDELESTVDGFRQLGVKKVCPCHCSGVPTGPLFKQYYGDDYIDSGVGKRIPLPPHEQGE